MTNLDWLKTLDAGSLAQCLEWNGNDGYMSYDEWYDWLNDEYDPKEPGWQWLESYRESQEEGGYEVRKVYYAYWVPIGPDSKGFTQEFQCSNCHDIILLPLESDNADGYKWCPYCGAKIIKEGQK